MEESKKIDKINSFLQVKYELVDIRSEFEYIDIKSKEINEEPSSLFIGPLEIELGYLNYKI